MGIDAAMARFEKFEPLAVYNAECARGIVHTPEWDAKMAELQREFDATHGTGERTGVRTADNRQSPTATTPGAATGR